MVGDADFATVAPEHPHADGMKRPGPEVARGIADHPRKTRFELAGGFIGERDAQDAIRNHVLLAEQVRDAVRKDARFAAACTRKDQCGPVSMLHGRTLNVTEDLGIHNHLAYLRHASAESLFADRWC